MDTSVDIVTVTVNPAIDQTITIPHFRAGAVNRVAQVRSDAGGKGINVAAFLADYGERVAATGFLGAENDTLFRSFFERKTIADRCVRLAGSTRTGIKIVDPIAGQTTDINFPGLAGGATESQALAQQIDALAIHAEWFVFAGSLPPELPATTYRDLIRPLVAEGKRVALDTSGAAFREALAAGPYLIKPNLDELQELVGAALPGETAIIEAAQRLAQEYAIGCVVVSMGKAGALFIEGTTVIRAIPPSVGVKSTVGAGDAMVAGAIGAKRRGATLEETARLATAFSVDAISYVGAGLSAAAAVERLKEQVTIHAL